MDKLETLKKKVIEILKKKATEVSGSVKKSLEQMDFIYGLKNVLTMGSLNKAGFGVGTVRIWKGKKYKKVAPDKWVRMYESVDRGAKSSMTRLINKADSCKSVEELLQFCMSNHAIFKDANGVDLPILEELRNAVDEKKAKLENGDTSSIRKPKKIVVKNPTSAIVTENTKEVIKEVQDIEKDKTEFNELVDRLNELNKEFSSNGGYSNRRTTREEDEKRIAAQKEIRVVEKQLAEFRKRIAEENKGNYKIPSVYHNSINEWIKRKVKGQTISGEWLRKKFGGYYSDVLSFGDGYSLSLSDTESINNPSVRINYEDSFKRPGYVVVDLEEMEKNENYRPRYMPQGDDKTFTDVWNKVNELKEQLNNATGETIAEKFFNTVLGVSNAYNENSDTSNIPRYRFTKDGIKDKNGKLEKINASVRDIGTEDEYIRLYADDYGASIPSIFYPENNTDMMTDYFEKDSCDVYPDHPYYNHLKVMALKRELYRGRSTKWAALTPAEQKEVENQIKELEKQLVEPTEEELKNYRERRDVEEERKEEWKEAQRRVYEKQMEERRKNQENADKEKLRGLLTQFADAITKEPPVVLEGLTKDQKIETLKDRISKLGIEINNLKDENEVARKIQYRGKLQQKLDEVQNEPDEVTEPQETDAEKTQNRSEAMMGNQNAYKGGSSEEIPNTNEKTDAAQKVEEAKQKLEEVKAQKKEMGGFEFDNASKKAEDELKQAKWDEKNANDTVFTPRPKVDNNVAQRINDISMSGHSGEVYQHDMDVEMKDFRDMFDVSKMNEQQKEYFQERLNAYAGLVGDSYNEMASKRLSAGPSWAVAGPAKFNTKRFQQKMDSEMRSYETFTEKKDKFIKNTQKRLKELKYTGGAESVDEVKQRVFNDYANGNWGYGDKIPNTDPYAIEKISGKIKFMEDAHDVTLLYGKLCKKNGLTNVTWTDKTDEEKAKRKEVLSEAVKLAKEKGYSDKVIKEGINSPFTANQTADIRRNKERLEELQKRQAVIEERKNTETTTGNTAANTGRVNFDGGYIYENPEMDRIQIIYDGKPERDVIDKLKHNGFRWSPSQGAWQRQLNRNGRMAVNRVLSETGINTKIDIDGAGEVTKSIPVAFIKNGRFLVRK